MKLLRILSIALVAALLATLGYVSHAQAPVTLAPWFYQQFENGAGVPIANGCVFTYQAGTSTPLATYTDSTGSFQNSNPIILDGGGFPPSGIWLTANAYRFVVFSSGGVNCATGTQMRVLDFVLPPPFLGANNAWTGNQTFAGSSTFNGAVNINGTTTFTGSVLGLPGSGTVTNLNVGNLNPLFTATVTNPTTTPSVTFAFVTPATGTGAPVFGTGPTISSAALTTPTLTTPTSTNAIFNTGINHGGTGFQHIRFTSCSTTSGTCAGTGSWNTSFADTSYTTTCSLSGALAGGASFSQLIRPLVKSAASFTYEFIDQGNGSGITQEIDCIAVHD
jgi:hypothetical protein